MEVSILYPIHPVHKVKFQMSNLLGALQFSIPNYIHYTTGQLLANYL